MLRPTMKQATTLAKRALLSEMTGATPTPNYGQARADFAAMLDQYPAIAIGAMAIAVGHLTDAPAALQQIDINDHLEG